MSLKSVRDAVLDTKKSEISACLSVHGRKLRALYFYSNLGRVPPRPHEFGHDLNHDATPTSEESRFLEENDLTKGRCFRDATLPFTIHFGKPLPTPSVPSLEKLFSTSTILQSPSQTDNPHTLVGEQAAPIDRKKQSTQNQSLDSVAKPTTASIESEHPPQPLPSALQPTSIPKIPTKTRTDVHNRSATPPTAEDPTIDPPSSLPPTVDEITNLPDSFLPKTGTPKGRRPAVVHLPPQEEQEKHLHNIDLAQENARQRERKEDEALLVSGSTDVVSSPSSTAGAQSTSTPKPVHHSPDTSPDVESGPRDIPNLRFDIAPTVIDHQSSSGHPDRCQGQKDGSRGPARSTSPITPDAQLRLEEEQAIKSARDKSRNPLSVPGQPNGPPLDSVLTNGAEEVVEETLDDEDRTGQAGLAGAKSLAQEAVNATAGTAPSSRTLKHTPNRSVDDTIVVNQTPDQDAEISSSTPASKHEVSSKDVVMQDMPISGPSEQTSSRLCGTSPATPSPAVTAPPERMTTRVASGAIRHKSVSEILGETPRTSSSRKEANHINVPSEKSPSSARKDKGKMPIVVFAKQDKTRSPVSNAGQMVSGDYASLKGASEDPDKDYLRTLFSYHANHTPGSRPLQDLIASANKTLTTSNHTATYRDTIDYRTVNRIYKLQTMNKWSLRQIESCAEPPRQITHFDHLLRQMKEMRTDFRQERRWKIAAAKNMAHWCVEWVNAPAERRLELQVRVKQKSIPTEDVQMEDDDPSTHRTPELVPSNTHDTESDSSLEEEGHASLLAARPPSALFSAGYDSLIFEMDNTPAKESVLCELPLYDTTPPTPPIRKPLVAVSKFVNGKIVPRVQGPPRKRSRYEYEEEAEDEGPSHKKTPSESSVYLSSGRCTPRPELPPEQSEIALFSPENKHVRDRLHASHAFRPPSEYPMPSISFFESRSSSQWLWEEDQKLRQLVKEFSYNWSLISDQLSFPSLVTSGAERRTPWECFERWVQLEGLPAEMSKTQYFRTYQSRLEAAQKFVTAQYQATQQQLQQQPQTPAQMLHNRYPRKTTQPIRVERRKNNRYLALVDAMRKLARKRESHQHKQQEAMKAAALRKAHEATQPRNNIHTPAQFSQMRHERELKIQERQEQYRLQIAQQRAAAMQRTGQMQGQGQQGGSATTQQQSNGVANNSQIPNQNGNIMGQTNNAAAPNGGMQPRQHPGQANMQNGMPNGTMPNGSLPSGTMGANTMAMPGVPQAQMQVSMQGPQRLAQSSPENMRIAMAQRATQAALQQQQQQQQLHMQQHLSHPASLANAHFASANGAMQNPQMFAAMASQVNGTANGMGGLGNNQARMSLQGHQMASSPQQLSNGHVPQIMQYQNSIQKRHPGMTEQQARAMALEQMRNNISQQQARQMATNAAAGPAASPSNHNAQINQNAFQQNAGISASPHMNNAQLHARALQQARMSGSPGMNSAIPVSRSQTPQNLHQRAGSGSMMQDGSSPRPPQAQIARPHS